MNSIDLDDFPAQKIKNVKLPEFKGTERDKDTMHTFLQMWTDIHDLRATLDRAQPLETSLSLRNKAYKWWLVLSANARPKMWRYFQILFYEEFLPKNEKQKIWNK